MKWRYLRNCCVWYKSIKKIFLPLLSEYIAISANWYFCCCQPSLGHTYHCVVGLLLLLSDPCAALAHLQLFQSTFKSCLTCSKPVMAIHATWNKSPSLYCGLQAFTWSDLSLCLTSFFIISSEFFIHLSWGQKVIKLVSFQGLEQHF